MRVSKAYSRGDLASDPSSDCPLTHFAALFLDVHLAGLVDQMILSLQ
jgi:hypothetical protein